MAQEAKIVLFRNFSDQVFSSVVPHEATVGESGKQMIVDENCKWGGEDYTFEPGEARYMPDWKAAHFAKHLANRELIKQGLDNDTSPKRPKDNPRYMALFNKAYIEDPKSMPMSESMGEDALIAQNKDLEIERLKAELEEAKKGEKNPPEAPHVGLGEGEADPTEKMVPHTITQEDIDNNPGIEKDVKVGDEVLLPPEDETEDEGFDGLKDGEGEDKQPE